MKTTLRILFVGDIVGVPGCNLVQKYIPLLRTEKKVDVVIVNAENCAPDGRGTTPKIVQALKQSGVDIITGGNHSFAKREMYDYFANNKDALRPANFPAGCPGTGVTTITVEGVTLGVINLQGRIFMRELVNCPFRAAESALTFLKTRTDCIFIDMHAETTSEKMGLGHFLDGKVSAIVGTHTHVQTADERILPGGTAFISDVGMCGAVNSMIGMKTSTVLQNMLTQMPSKFEVETEGPMRFSAVLIDIDTATGKAQKIERISIIDEK